MSHTAHSVLPPSATVEDGRLRLAGCDAVELAHTFGTPAYIVCEDDLRAQARRFVDLLAAHHEGEGRVVFASKAFPAVAVLRLLAEEGLWCDVASGGELHLALAAGFPAARLLLHGNAKSEAELRAAVEAGVGRIVLDNLSDLDKIERIAAERGAGGPVTQVLMRITPGVEADTHASIATGQADSKFGFSMADAPAAIDRVRRSAAVRLMGLHVHLGSQLFDPEPFGFAAAAIAGLGRFPEVDLGGGLGVPYLAGDRVLDVERYVQANARAAREHFGAGVALMLEPGRSMVAATGVTLYTVESVKRNARTWVGVDGGMSDNLRPMLYGSRYEVAVADRMDRTDGEECTVAGKHCESGDVLVRHAKLPEPAPGDVLVTPVTGAYGHAMANNYNGVPRPPVVFVAGGRAREVVRRETLDDLLARDIAPQDALPVDFGGRAAGGAAS